MFTIKQVPLVCTQFLLILFIVFLLTSCETGVEPSPDPGIIRVILTSDPSDTSIVIVREPINVQAGDNFPAVIFQGKAIRDDEAFFVLFPDLFTHRQRDEQYNIIARTNNGYDSHIIFESHLPPGNYDTLEFGLVANQLNISTFQIPVTLPSDENPILKFYTEYEIIENGVTEIQVLIKPLESVKRFRNSFIFERNIQVLDVEYPS